MKINADVYEVLYGRRGAGVAPPDKRVANSNRITPQIHESVSTNASRGRELIDAFIIANMAQVFINKALEISSRLRNIASEAITGGKIEYTEFSEVMSSIKISLSEMNEGMVNTVDLANVENRGIGNGDEDIINSLPPIKSEIDKLNILSSELESGGRPELNRIDILSDNLSNKAILVENLLSNARNTIIDPMSNYYYNPNTDYSKSLGQIGRELIENPNIAIRTQGNVNPEMLRSLL
ncbi:MAG: hypothetical protein SVZ03_03220 [Spirochaetota bacterium]|nr:hypothetical protein [Spirochaetota bacterium]